MLFQKGMTFYLTPGVSGNLRTGLEIMIDAAGGQVDKNQHSMTDVRAKAKKNPRKYIIITSMEDYEYFHEFFLNKSSKPLSKHQRKKT